MEAPGAGGYPPTENSVPGVFEPFPYEVRAIVYLHVLRRPCYEVLAIVYLHVLVTKCLQSSCIQTSSIVSSHALQIANNWVQHTLLPAASSKYALPCGPNTFLPGPNSGCMFLKIYFNPS